MVWWKGFITSCSVLGFGLGFISGPHDVTMTSESLVWYKVDAYDVVQ